MKNLHLIIISFLLLVTHCGPNLSSDSAAMSYVIGYDFTLSQTNDIKSINAVKKALNDFPVKDANDTDPIYTSCFNNLEILKNQNIILHKEGYLEGAKDALEKNKLAISHERFNLMKTNYHNIIAKYNTITNEDFENNLKNDKSLSKTGSGLYYRIINPGSKNKPDINSRVTVHMIGRLPNGFEFSNTYLKKTPVQFYVKTTVKGITEALQMIGTGGRYIFYIPPKLAYGDKKFGIIPPNSYLIYEIELIDVKKKG